MSHIVQNIRPDDIWTPAKLNPEFWIDLSDVDTVDETGGAIAGVTNKGHKGSAATQTSAGAKPTYVTSVQNGLNVARFDGTGDYLNVTDMSTSTTDITAFFSLQFISIGSLDSLFHTDGTWATGNVHYLMITGPNRTQFSVNDCTAASDDHPDTNSFSTGTWYNHGAVNDGSDLEFWTDGIARGTSSTVYSGGKNIGSINIGSWDTSRYLNADVGEVIICERALSQQERYNLEGYLAWKWGTTASLPDSHPYKWNGFKFGYGWTPV